MDSLHREDRPQTARPALSPQPARTTSNLQHFRGSSGQELDLGSGISGPLRRGHSDGDFHGPPFNGTGDDRGHDEATWIDFLQESLHPERSAGISPLGTAIRSFGNPDQGRRQERQASMQRAALMMADRKRRLTENQEDYNHRRSASNLTFGPSTISPRSSLPPPHGNDWNFTRPGRAPSSSTMDRPLPPPPETASRRNHEIQPPRDDSPITRAGRSAGIEVVDLTGDEEPAVEPPPSNTHDQDTPQSPPIKIDPALGGGQEVRLCNPCVPDPNPLPHLPFEATDPSTMHSFPRPPFDGFRVPNSADSSTSGVRRRSSSTRQSFDRVPLPGRDASGRSAGSVPVDREQEPDFSRFPSRHSSRLPPDFTSLYGSVPNHPLHELRHRHHASASNVPSSRYRSVSDAPHSTLPPHSHPARPQPQLREEDECPICHQALPPKGPDGSETGREAHVSECIAQHFSSSIPRTGRPHPSMATEAAVVANAASGAQSANRDSGSQQQQQERRESESAVQGSNSGNNAFERMGSQRRRVVGMFKYLATEKDCIGEGGEPAECVICFEEFEQGVEMGRLECLCKFHKVSL
ncbi:MAG: hypothetical protein Q9215_002236 [Flavoplaca cf. flavocitrina]